MSQDPNFSPSQNCGGSGSAANITKRSLRAHAQMGDTRDGFRGLEQAKVRKLRTRQPRLELTGSGEAKLDLRIAKTRSITVGIRTGNRARHQP
jgi:hypothetical protein